MRVPEPGSPEELQHALNVSVHMDARTYQIFKAQVITQVSLPWFSSEIAA